MVNVELRAGNAKDHTEFTMRVKDTIVAFKYGKAQVTPELARYIRNELPDMIQVIGEVPSVKDLEEKVEPQPVVESVIGEVIDEDEVVEEPQEKKKPAKKKVVLPRRGKRK